jgi:protein-S-isoprenylcysteine O-methyltransferase Ste14
LAYELAACLIFFATFLWLIALTADVALFPTTVDQAIGGTSAGLTLYILIGIAHEERDLVSHSGPSYDDYRRRVGMLLPGLGRRR